MKQLSVLKEETLKRFMDIFEASHEGLWGMGPDFQIDFLNRSFYNAFAVSTEGANLKEWTSLVHPDDVHLFTQKVEQKNDNMTTVVDSEYRVKNKVGEYRWIAAKGTSRFDPDGSFIYMAGSHKDVTEEKENQHRLYQTAYIDPNTGLMNAHKLLQDLKGNVSRPVGALLFIKLMNFNVYIDSYGAHAGHKIVRKLLTCLEQLFVGDGQFYRQKSSEFVIRITNPVTSEQIEKSIEQLLAIFKNTGKDLQNNDIPNLSVGICMLPSSAECEKTLLHQVKLTMIYAHEHTEQKFAFFNEQIKHIVKKKLYIKTAMKSALHNNEFLLKFQPLIQSQTKNVDSFEALIRWESPIFGEIMPDEFIPAAEQNLNIIDIGYFVIEQACTFICHYHQVNDRRVKIAINISGIQLLQHDFVDRVLSIVSQFMLNNSDIVLEITESLLLDSNHFAKEQITRLRDKGFSISMDDFGSGYSSLNNFFTLPFTQLKIDRQVVNQSMMTTEARAYLVFLIQLCQNKDIEVVAEGIETQEMSEAMLAIGVNLLQGYLFSKPASAPAALKFVNTDCSPL
ncbi:putative bifunctional diguanylate cyclase/phosphodiesterase [Psychromonas sp. MB-3u-54]|uniref:putative bifunctional diguanylate cyclase/phosphodiesterase n=1 Tax=Psychromonas sp. MB-3u-54 TaxID=2058319 RepID=UPI0018E36ECE|nr:EAL domain-containing protein [Psychromonas sp. MB-3u-54]